ncbi:MAG: DUF1385 domain-containing protein [Oscillospiraceae bacterium]|nr:DUF1385 domain-containing protein [Oscillospiraceae bacterium]
MSKNKPNADGKKTTVGGQALIEGVMMKGVSVGAMAVRQKDGEIYTEEWELPKKRWFNKAPFIRGCFNFVQTLKEGYSCMNKSIDISGMADDDDDEPQTKLDEWLDKHVSEKGVEVIAGVLSFLLIVVLMAVFFFVPSFLFSLLEGAVGNGISPWKSAFEGVFKLLLFVAYMALVAQMKTMKRVYEYHGAEHKTIACYEAGKELTVDNIMPMCRFHPRCGTSFIIITLLVSILVYSVVPIDPAGWWGISNKALGALLRVMLKLPLLPFVVGISYELIRLAGKYTNPITKFFSAPGLWMQRLTTREPDASQIECAIAAVKPCLPKDGEDDNW